MNEIDFLSIMLWGMSLGAIIGYSIGQYYAYRYFGKRIQKLLDKMEEIRNE